MKKGNRPTRGGIDHGHGRKGSLRKVSAPGASKEFHGTPPGAKQAPSRVRPNPMNKGKAR